MVSKAALRLRETKTALVNRLKDAVKGVIVGQFLWNGIVDKQIGKGAGNHLY